ncbi:hypothetical protein ABG768_008527 [Culter alburnus]|uniref:Uncharacterized protein n=1 Tax=Culter alburnus TaxID=194366 RepID=A0AAW1ZJ73_CULAL
MAHVFIRDPNLASPPFTKPLPPICLALFFRFNSRGEGETKDPRGHCCNLLASARSPFVPASFPSLAFSCSRQDLWNFHLPQKTLRVSLSPKTGKTVTTTEADPVTGALSVR